MRKTVTVERNIPFTWNLFDLPSNGIETSLQQANKSRER
jgi:hypothetical protein